MRSLIILLAFLGFFIISCNQNPSNIYSQDGIEVVSVEESNEFNNATLTSMDIKLDDTMGCHVLFDVENYILKADSKNNLTGLCANSKDGQHIHFIVDNKPYSALYEPKHTFQSDSGSHLALAFLSRSHHQSIKNKNAYKLVQFNAGAKNQDFDLTKPYLFYSRPKGVYVGDDAKNIMLDFYLVNTEISPNGNKVKAVLDDKHSFYISAWNPYLIKGLDTGEHKIVLSLVDSENHEIPTPFLPVERSFSIQVNP